MPVKLRLSLVHGPSIFAKRPTSFCDTVFTGQLIRWTMPANFFVARLTKRLVDPNVGFLGDGGFF